jgi:hypothetical protein
VLGEVAHPLQIAGNMQGGDDQPQVAGDGRLPGEHLLHLLLGLPVEGVDLGVLATTDSPAARSASRSAAVALRMATRPASAIETSSRPTSSRSVWNSWRISRPGVGVVATVGRAGVPPVNVVNATGPTG